MQGRQSPLGMQNMKVGKEVERRDQGQAGGSVNCRIVKSHNGSAAGIGRNLKYFVTDINNQKASLP